MTTERDHLSSDEAYRDATEALARRLGKTDALVVSSGVIDTGKAMLAWSFVKVAMPLPWNPFKRRKWQAQFDAWMIGNTEQLPPGID